MDESIGMSGPNMGVISSMQHHSQNMQSGGGDPNSQLSFGVESNVIQSITGEDPKGGGLISLATFGLNSMAGMNFDSNLFSATQGISTVFNLPTGPTIGLPKLNPFGQSSQKGR